MALDIAIWVAGGLLFWKAFETWQGKNREKLPNIIKKIPCEK